RSPGQALAQGPCELTQGWGRSLKKADGKRRRAGRRCRPAAHTGGTPLTGVKLFFDDRDDLRKVDVQGAVQTLPPRAIRRRIRTALRAQRRLQTVTVGPDGVIPHPADHLNHLLESLEQGTGL